MQRIRGRTRSRTARPVCSFACLPLPDIDASLEELSYALDVLGLDGVVLFTNSNGVYLGDAVLEPVFEELERRKAVVFVHPNPSPDAVAHSLGLPDNLLDFPTDTNRAVAQMHYTNRFARTPNVKYIFSHAGGSIPYLAARFAIIDEMGFIAGGEQRGTAADMFRRMYWDTALAASDPVLRMLRDVAGIDRFLRNGLSVPAPRPRPQIQATNLAELCVERCGTSRRSRRQRVTPFFLRLRPSWRLVMWRDQPLPRASRVC